MILFFLFLLFYIKQTVLSGINPYMWDESADSVTSSVLKFGLSNCDQSPAGRQKRATPNSELTCLITAIIVSACMMIYVQHNSLALKFTLTHSLIS